MEAAVEILEVRVPSLDYGSVYGGFIDGPKTGDKLEVYRLEITGWVLGRSAPVTSVVFISEGKLLGEIPVNLERPDIGAAFPDVEQAGRSGFQWAISAVHLRTEFELQVRGILENGTRVELATIRGRRKSLKSESSPELRPLLVTTLGRTGSSWLMLLLAQHPGIVAYRPFAWEPRVASYWLAVLKTLSEPASYLQMINPDLVGGMWWTGEQHSEKESHTRHLINHLRRVDPELFRWLGRSQVESFVRFLQERVEGFYKQVARMQERSDAVFFAEKHYPDNFIIPRMWELYPDAREVFLVRDFRDVICSVLSFNKKLGYASFGREQVESDEDYVAVFRRQAEGMLHEWREREAKSHLVRYEDLILKPEETLRPVFEYLGLESGDDTIQEVLRRAAETSAEAQKGHQTSGGPAASIGRWKQDLTPSMQAACEETLGDLLRKFGYE